MIASYERGFLFLKTRKTAGTSLEIALSRTCGERDVITAVKGPDESVRSQHGGRQAQNTVHPVSGQVATNHMSARATREFVGRPAWRSLEKVAVERNPWDVVVSQYYWVMSAWEATARERIPFRRFVLELPHVTQLATSNARAYRIRGEVVVDRVLRYESLAEDVATLWADLRLPGRPELPHAKGGTRPVARHYRELHDDDTRARVAEAFAYQVDRFGYEF